jgi:hypothetical protein
MKRSVSIALVLICFAAAFCASHQHSRLSSQSALRFVLLQRQASTEISKITTAGTNIPHRRRTWDPNFLNGLRDASEGATIAIELVAGNIASGKIRHLDRCSNEVIYVSGTLSKPEPGRFFLQKQTLPGVAGNFVGVIELPASKRAYRLEPTGPGGESELVERSLADVICLGLPQRASGTTNVLQEIPPLDPDQFPSVPIPPYQNGIIVLESLPGPYPVIYLDFQGGYTPTWGGISYGRPAFTNAQIREIWKRVAEDFMPFTINVTTDAKVFTNTFENARKRVIITPTDTADPGAGGVSYEGSFNWTGDTPCWVFELTTPASCAQSCSHEVGHTLGLFHDGQYTNGAYSEYYYGHGGNGETGWAPIMGVAYYDNVAQWSKGEYVNANNLQDQLAIISSQNNNVRYRPDDTGDTLATSRFLEVYADYTASA